MIVTTHTQLTTADEAHAYLTMLHNAGMAYHPDDLAAECLGHFKGLTDCDFERIGRRMDDHEWGVLF